jgi:hypothetical protein
MPEMTTGAALRQLQQAQAGMKKVRQALRLAAGDPDAAPRRLGLGWQSLAQAHRLMAAVPLSAANDEVMTRQLAVQRYATALLVRLRRIERRDFSASDVGEVDLGDEDA